MLCSALLALVGGSLALALCLVGTSPRARAAPAFAIAAGLAFLAMLAAAVGVVAAAGPRPTSPAAERPAADWCGGDSAEGGRALWRVPL